MQHQSGTPTQVTRALRRYRQKILKNRPPQISDEEQRINVRQRCTLSQLRSGHCHLLQDYKHRVFGEPSDICTECGASSQDVRHLFACTTHPTDLSPEDLWRNPVRSIRAFSYVDNGNLDCLEDGPWSWQTTTTQTNFWPQFFKSITMLIVQ